MTSTDKQHALNLFKKGKLTQAEKVYLKVTKKNPSDPEIHYMLGAIYGQLGRLDKAKKHFSKCIEIHPQSAMSHLCLGGVYRNSNPLKASEFFFKAYQLNPDLLDAYYEYAVVQYYQGEFQVCTDACHTIISKDPNYFKANLLLGNIKLEQRDDEGAIKYYKDALKSNPSFGEAHYQLGNLYYRMGQFDSSIESFKKSIQFITAGFDPYISYGRVLMTIGKIEEAENAYRKSLKINKNNVDAVAGLASIHEYRKDYAKTNEILRPIVEECTKPSINVIGIYAKICKRYNTCETLLKYINFVESQDVKIDWNNRCIINFTKASIYDKTGDYGRAFHEFKKANDQVPDKYNKTNHELQVNDLKKVYTYNYMLQCLKADTSYKYIFIVGMPRSGTSLVEQILDSHSDVFGAGELAHLQNISKIMHSPIDSTSYPKCMPHMDQSALQHYADFYKSEVEKLSQKTIIVDKMPHNYLHIGLISQLFPNSKIIHCKRNPIDTCLSIYFQNFNDTHTYANKLTNIAHHYKIYVDIMKHWYSLFADNIYTVEYEELVKDFGKQSRSLVEFCEIEWQDSCSEFFKNERHVSTASQDQVNKPIYDTSVSRWVNYESHINDLVDELRKYKLIN